jgi:hypothetical protein
MCFGNWPCVMKTTAPKCRVCGGGPCSFYDPKAVETEPESTHAKGTARTTVPKTTKTAKSSSPNAASSKRRLSELSDRPELRHLLQLPELSDSEPEAESPQPKKRNKPTKSSSSKAASSFRRQSSELSELPKFPELPELSDSETDPECPQPKKKTQHTKTSSSAPTPSKRQFIDLSELSDGDSDPIEPQGKRKRTKSKSELTPAVNEKDGVEGQGIDDGKYWHNCPITRKLIVKLEGQGWYKMLEGQGHCQRALIQMETLHWRSLREMMDDEEGDESNVGKYWHNCPTTRKLIVKLEGQGWYNMLEGQGHCQRALVQMEQLHWRSLNRQMKDD